MGCTARGEVGVRRWHVAITMRAFVLWMWEQSQCLVDIIAVRQRRCLETAVIFQKTLTEPLRRAMHEHAHCREGMRKPARHLKRHGTT